MNNTMEAPATPVTGAERIVSIDVLRGFALLGILMMNIPFFALSQYVFPDPRHAGGFEGLDYAVWHGSELLFNLKMMAIFSMLFGAGVVIFSERTVAKGGRPGKLHYKRMFWLLLIGLVHAYVIWFGDILVPYVICGCVVFLARNWPAKVLVVIAPVVMSVAVLMGQGYGIAIEEARDSMLDAQAALNAGEALTEEQEQALYDWELEFEPMYPTPELLEWERDLRKEQGVQLLFEHAQETVFWQTFGMIFWGFWRISGLMLLGMGLYKLRVFDATRSLKVYGAMVIVGYGVGITLVSFGIRALLANEFAAAEFFPRDSVWNYYGSVFVALGHIGLVMTVCKLGALRWLTRSLAAVGRMALTNYLMHSLICTFLFYWWGLGLWGTMSRSELVLVVVAIWIGQLVLSPIWLARFRFGPMEWLWRSLTYWKRQPMRRVGDSAA